MEAGISGEATAGVLMVGFSSCPDLALLLWPLLTTATSPTNYKLLLPSIQGITWFSSILLGHFLLVPILFLPRECGDSLGLT